MGELGVVLSVLWTVVVGFVAWLQRDICIAQLEWARPVATDAARSAEPPAPCEARRNFDRPRRVRSVDTLSIDDFPSTPATRKELDQAARIRGSRYRRDVS